MKKTIFLIILISIFTAAGCADTGSRRSSDTTASSTLEVATALKFDDVPVPSGFKLVADDSFIFDNDVMRLGILKYSGRPDASVVVKFYKDQMPLYNWRFINLMEFNTRIINFDRDDQTCTIIVEPRQLSTQVTVSVAPKAGRAATYKVDKSSR
ncbi:MAG: hypothetical protein V2A72_08435 [Candidatus Omnitrophota bacterium]